MGAVISIWVEIGEWAIVAERSVVKLKQIIPPKKSSLMEIQPKLYGKQLRKIKNFGVGETDLY